METASTMQPATSPANDVSTPLVAAAHSHPQSGLKRTIIEPASGWQLVNVRELWRYRELLFFLTWRDVKVRYKQTLLGAAWAILQPGLMMVVFTIFFGKMAKVPAGDLPYPIFVFAGLLPWTFFATAIANAGNSVVGSERLITKIYFPRLAVPFASVGAALVDFAIAFVMLLVMMLWYHVMPTPKILLVPALVVVLMLAALGIGTLLAALNVAYRDFRYVIPFLVQIWMFATPSVYMAVNPAMTDGRTRGVAHYALALNPMTGLVSAFRGAMLDGPIPWLQAGVATLLIVAIFIGGCLYFRRVEDSFADLI